MRDSNNKNISADHQANFEFVVVAEAVVNWNTTTKCVEKQTEILDANSTAGAIIKSTALVKLIISAETFRKESLRTASCMLKKQNHKVHKKLNCWTPSGYRAQEPQRIHTKYVCCASSGNPPWRRQFRQLGAAGAIGIWIPDIFFMFENWIHPQVDN